MNYCLRLIFASLGLFVLLLTSCDTSGETNDTTEGLESQLASTDTSSIEFQMDQLNKKIEISPDEYQLYYRRSLLFYESGNTQKAIEDIEKSINRSVDTPEPYHLRGFYAYVQNDHEKALLYFQRAADQGSDNPETYYSTGQIHFLNGDYDEAAKWYQTAMELDPEDPTYSFAIGFLNEARGNTDEAVKWYNTALERDPEFVKALSRMYEIYINLKEDPRTAIEFNKKILQVDSLHPVGRFNQGTYYYNMANSITDPSKSQEFEMLLKLAVSEYSRSIFADPNYALAWYNRGYCFYLLDRIDEALSDFNKVLEIDETNEKALFMRGSIFEFYGDLKSALNNYEMALKIDPGFEEAQVAVNELRKKLNP